MSNERDYRPAFTATLTTTRTFLEPLMTSLPVGKQKASLGQDERAAEIEHLKMLRADSVAAFKKLFPAGAIIDSGSEFLE